MKVIQLLPALNSGGVERGTLDMARALVEAGHESLVISSGGVLVERLQNQGSRHITLPIHRKSPLSLLQVRPLRRLIEREKPDILHVRSRMPAWITRLAWRKIPRGRRPRLVSTAHGLYSVNRYSAIMARGERVIAISECVRDYLLENYAGDLKNPPVLIYRGADTEEFFPGLRPPADWKAQVESEFPQLRGKRWLLMPGRLTRWKGQEDFIDLVARLAPDYCDIQGVILGGAEPDKVHYQEKLKQRVRERRVADRISFVGRRADIRYWYQAAALVFNLSSRTEPFGRTVIEAAAVGTPVVGYDIGGPAESLRACFPRGLVDRSDPDALYRTVRELLDDPPARSRLTQEFTLQTQARRTIELYRSLLAHDGCGAAR